jgi:putative phosphoribosyl transferase
MFANREDAALQLGLALANYRNKGVIVLGIPRGGAETAYYVARQLQAVQFSLLIVRKLGHPQNPEFALGAIAEDGTIYYTPGASTRISRQTMNEIEAFERKEIERRKRTLRMNRPLPDISSRIVIIVDDGIATGATIFAAIHMCRNKGAGKIIVASPVAALDKVYELEQIADEVVVLLTPPQYYAVSQVYDSFYNLTDDEALEFIEKWERENQVRHY